MNLPNKLTVLRMALVPVFLVFMLCTGIPYHGIWALLIFAVASLTDMLDGKIARARGLVTDFGKFMDPLADKILVMAAMLCFVEQGWAPAALVVVILAREFLVTSLRLIAAGSGKVIAADKWGKLKTVAQMVWIIVGLLFGAFMDAQAAANGPGGLYAIPAIYTALMWLALALTIVSGVNYVWKNRACISQM